VRLPGFGRGPVGTCAILRDEGYDTRPSTASGNSLCLPRTRSQGMWRFNRLVPRPNAEPSSG
jgi:hypothetical protein